MKLAVDELIVTCLALLAASIFLFSWLPHPDIGNLPFFPKWLGKWINHYGNLRTAVPFFLIAVFLEYSLKKSLSYRKWILLASFLLVTLAEAGQLLLPKRHSDICDIFWGTAGAALGMAAGWVVRKRFAKSSKV